MAQTTRKRSIKAESLGPGLHGGHVELESNKRFRVRLGDGRACTASLAPGVEVELVRECLRARRMVILIDSPRGPCIAGALQTEAPVVHRERGDVVTLRARELRLVADEHLRLEAGPVTVAADESGKLRLEGDRLVIDMAALVKILSMRVELP